MNAVIDQVKSLATESGKIQDSLKNIDSVLTTNFNYMVKEHNVEQETTLKEAVKGEVREGMDMQIKLMNTVNSILDEVKSSENVRVEQPILCTV